MEGWRAAVRWVPIILPSVAVTVLGLLIIAFFPFGIRQAIGAGLLAVGLTLMGSELVGSLDRAKLAARLENLQLAAEPTLNSIRAAYVVGSDLTALVCNLPSVLVSPVEDECLGAARVIRLEDEVKNFFERRRRAEQNPYLLDPLLDPLNAVRELSMKSGEEIGPSIANALFLGNIVMELALGRTESSTLMSLHLDVDLQRRMMAAGIDPEIVGSTTRFVRGSSVSLCQLRVSQPEKERDAGDRGQAIVRYFLILDDYVTSLRKDSFRAELCRERLLKVRPRSPWKLGPIDPPVPFPRRFYAKEYGWSG